MIITNTKSVLTRDLLGFGWANLRRFHDVAYVEGVLEQLHSIPKKHRQNARKQARQIRLCLMQAREYADAAEAVSLVTKPTLYYYSLMSLALAEILLKQPGDSSLDMMREKN